MMRAVRMMMVAGFCAAVGACALRVGGPGPEDFETVALRLEAPAAATSVAQRIRSADADIVLLSAPQDTAWFREVATAVRLGSTRPAQFDGRGMAFLTNMEIIGDTTLVLDVPGGGTVRMHDALYSISSDRWVDLMMVELHADDLRAAVRTLLAYIATDVSGTASLVLALDAATPAAADSATALMRATLASARDCRDAEVDAVRPRLLYGPSARMTCVSAGVLSGEPAAVRARLRVR